MTARPPEERVPSSTAGMAEPPEDVASFVRDALADFRRRNAVVIGWLRIGLNASLLCLFAWAAHAGLGPWYATGVVTRSVVVAGSVAVLACLRRGRGIAAAIAAGVGLDFASLIVAGWRVTHAPASSSAIGHGILLAVAELVLLSGALVLRETTLAALALAVCAAAVAWSFASFSWPIALSSALAVTVFGIFVVWAARRVVRLAVEQSLQSYRAQLLRAHRDELDVTNRRLERSNREILDAQRQAELLTQLLVHDLKNPLAVVLASLEAVHEAIAREPRLSEARGDLEIARGEASRLSGMIGDILLVSRLERGELRGQLAAVRVVDVMGALASATRVRTTASRVLLEVDADEGLVAWVDASLLRRLLENLLSNALRFTPAGGRIQLVARAQGGSLLLAVRNSGAPVTATARAQLFQKYAVHGELEPQNCGLGLYLCRLVAEAHHGRIALADREGWNVSFEVELPLAPGAAPDAGAGTASGIAPFDARLPRSSRRTMDDPLP
jgi:signal transduction histidine kinase